MAPHTPNETRPSLTALLIGLASLTLALASNASAEIVLPPIPGGVLLETDGSTALHSARLPLGLPFGVGLIRAEFDIAFGTRERPVPGAFLDSFSLFFEPPDTDGSALLYHHDAHGENWLPDHPGGVGLPSDFLRRTDIPFPVDGVATWPIHASFAVSLTLPVEWQNCEAGLWLDLFDNRTDPNSFAQLSNLRLVARNPFFLLESSATPVGPFSVEMGVVHSLNDRRFELLRGGVARFFRLRADSAVRLRLLERDPEDWRFAYDFPEPDPRLESATQPQGPYTPQTNAVLDPERREFQFTSTGGPARFFRILANVRTAITRLESSGRTNRIRFEYRPRVFSLQSSAQPCGPFADDPAARFDTARQIIALSRTQFIRTFRITHSDPGNAVRMLGVQGDDARWILPYEVRSSPTPTNASPQPRESLP